MGGHKNARIWLRIQPVQRTEGKRAGKERDRGRRKPFNTYIHLCLRRLTPGFPSIIVNTFQFCVILFEPGFCHIQLNLKLGFYQLCPTLWMEEETFFFSLGKEGYLCLESQTHTKPGKRQLRYRYMSSSSIPSASALEWNAIGAFTLEGSGGSETLSVLILALHCSLRKGMEIRDWWGLMGKKP